MFIKKEQRPWIEFDPEAGQLAPTIVHYFSDRCDPFKTVLPQLIEGASQDEERVFVVESSLSEIIDETIALHREPESKDRVVIDEKQRVFFDAIKLSLVQALVKIEQINFVEIDANGGSGECT